MLPRGRLIARASAGYNGSLVWAVGFGVASTAAIQDAQVNIKSILSGIDSLSHPPSVKLTIAALQARCLCTWISTQTTETH